MRIHVLSDLHNEFGEIYQPANVGADLVILAGDIDIKARGVTWAREAFYCPVAYVPGNHEYYHGNLGRTLLKMIDAGDDRVRVLDCEEYIVGDIRVLGATGWTDYTATGNKPMAEWDAQNTMADFHQIRRGHDFRRVFPRDFIELNHYARRWLLDRFDEPFHGKTVVVTHHAPSMESLHGAPHAGSLLNAAYANRWEEMFGRCDLWIHGHSHHAVDYTANGTRVVSNPKGYPGESVSGFQPDFVIEL